MCVLKKSVRLPEADGDGGGKGIQVVKNGRNPFKLALAQESDSDVRRLPGQSLSVTQK
jgi:hypothetical protein